MRLSIGQRYSKEYPFEISAYKSWEGFVIRAQVDDKGSITGTPLPKSNGSSLGVRELKVLIRDMEEFKSAVARRKDFVSGVLAMMDMYESEYLELGTTKIQAGEITANVLQEAIKAEVDRLLEKEASNG